MKDDISCNKVDSADHFHPRVNLTARPACSHVVRRRVLLFYCSGGNGRIFDRGVIRFQVDLVGCVEDRSAQPIDAQNT